MEGLRQLTNSPMVNKHVTTPHNRRHRHISATRVQRLDNWKTLGRGVPCFIDLRHCCVRHHLGWFKGLDEHARHRPHPGEGYVHHSGRRQDAMSRKARSSHNPCTRWRETAHARTRGTWVRSAKGPTRWTESSCMASGEISVEITAPLTVENCTTGMLVKVEKGGVFFVFLLKETTSRRVQLNIPRCDKALPQNATRAPTQSSRRRGASKKLARTLQRAHPCSSTPMGRSTAF